MVRHLGASRALADTKTRLRGLRDHWRRCQGTESLFAESCGVFVSGLHATRLVTRTKESNVCASHWVRVETQRRNESESRRPEALAVLIRSHRERDDARTGVLDLGKRPRWVRARKRPETDQAGRSPGAPRHPRCPQPGFRIRFGSVRLRRTQSVHVRTREMMNYTWSG